MLSASEWCGLSSLSPVLEKPQSLAKPISPNIVHLALQGCSLLPSPQLHVACIEEAEVLFTDCVSTTTAGCATSYSQGTMDSGDEYFFNNFICLSDDSSLDDEELVVAASVINGHIAR